MVQMLKKSDFIDLGSQTTKGFKSKKLDSIDLGSLKYFVQK